ncbi:DUF4393 domain-containing protein [Achromobacter xylosoxidans]|uniref:DUF4393 domain-containing protein n=1 Tax=Alcaligenes xylosoxydans xylosoxydans TaxID=85698 RepID=UPI00320A348C
MSEQAESSHEEPSDSALVPVISQTWAAVADKALEAASDSPDVKATGLSLGRSARTLAQTIETCLLPLAAVNFAVSKARDYFADSFGKRLEAQAQDIPPDSLRDPAPAVAASALQALAFAHEEQSLESMYLALLATSMDGRTPKDAAHPAFVEIVRQLTGDEAQILQVFLSPSNIQGIAQIRTQKPRPETFAARPQVTVCRYLTPLTLDGAPVEVEGIGAMFDNWIRLGLIEVDFTRRFTTPSAYEWAEKRPELIRARAQHETDTDKVVAVGGILVVTEFGQRFAAAVGLRPRLQK